LGYCPAHTTFLRLSSQNELFLRPEDPTQSVLGVNNEYTYRDESINSALGGLENSYNAANAYSIFNGSTALGASAGWYGFKRDDTRASYAILFMGWHGIFKAYRLHTDASWHLYQISNIQI